MSPQRTAIDPAIILRHLREKAKATRAAYQLAQPSDKAAAFRRFEAAMLALDDALMEERPPVDSKLVDQSEI
jgi:hypothetical protein